MQPAVQIVEKIDSFLAKSGMAPSTFGLKAVNSSHLVERLRRAIRAPRPTTVARIESYIVQAEQELQERLDHALEKIRTWEGYVQIDLNGDPVALPPRVNADTVRLLIESGQLVPAGDSLFGEKSQTYRPAS